MLSIKLYNGDCLEIMKTIEDKSIDLILCDLPYGTTANKWDEIIPLQPLWEQYKRICSGTIVLTAQTPFDKVLGASNLKWLRYEWIWQKEYSTGFLNAKKTPLKSHENILVFYEKLKTYNPQMRLGFKPYVKKPKSNYTSSNYGKYEPNIRISGGERYPLSILNFSRDKDTIHPTQKPVALMEYLIKTYTNENETVLDNCMGSGTTGIACLNANRKFIGIEKDENYFNLAKNRIESYSPINHSNLESFLN